MASRLATIRDAWARRRPPAQVRAAIRAADDSGERVLSWAPVVGGGAVAVTNRALWQVQADGVGLRLFHHDIDRAAWEIPTLSVTPSVGAAFDLALDDPGSVPRDLRTRVEASVALTQRHRLTIRRVGVRVVARRPSTGGPLQWRLAYDDPADVEDAAVRAEAEELLASTRRSGEA